MQAETVYMVLALVIAVVLHELAHGVVARMFGDQTAQAAGRLTLNPVKHVDPMGSIAVPAILAISQLATIGHVAFMYGWARPVPVNPMRLQVKGRYYPRQLMAVVAFAGPLMNFFLAVCGGVLLYAGYAQDFLWYFIMVNLSLGIFNLLPVPPMDGGRIAVGLLPLRAAHFLARGEKIGIVAVLLLLFVLPTALGQFGVHWDPLGAAMSSILPWAEQKTMLLTGHGA